MGLNVLAIRYVNLLGGNIYGGPGDYENDPGPAISCDYVPDAPGCLDNGPQWSGTTVLIIIGCMVFGPIIWNAIFER
jgi:hypothetical protein